MRGTLMAHPRPYRIRESADEHVRVAKVIDDVLVVFVPPGLDEFTQQRYADEAIQALQWYEPDRRGVVVPIAAAGTHIRNMAHSHTAGALAAVIVMSGAAGLAAYTVSTGDGRKHVPSAAVPAVPRPTPSRPTAGSPHGTPHPGTKVTPQPPRTPVTVAAADLHIPAPTPVADALPAAHVPAPPIHIPSPPVTAPPVKPPPLPIPKPTTACLAHLAVAGVADVRVGCNTQ